MCRKLGVDFASLSRLRVAMDENTRDLINHLGAELAGVMEDTSATAALLRGIEPEALAAAIDGLVAATEKARAIAAAMRALTSPDPRP